MATWTDLTFITKSRKMIYDYINKLIDVYNYNYYGVKWMV